MIRQSWYTTYGMKNICRKEHNKRTKKYKMICNGCGVVRMGHYGDWCTCSNPQYTLTSTEPINIKIPKGLGKLLI